MPDVGSIVVICGAFLLVHVLQLTIRIMTIRMTNSHPAFGVTLQLRGLALAFLMCGLSVPRVASAEDRSEKEPGARLVIKGREASLKYIKTLPHAGAKGARKVEEIQAVVRKRTAQVRMCLNGRYRGAQTAKNEVHSVFFAIEPDGHVSAAASKQKKDKKAACLASLVRNWDFGPQIPKKRSGRSKRRAKNSQVVATAFHYSFRSAR